MTVQPLPLVAALCATVPGYGDCCCCGLRPLPWLCFCSCECCALSCLRCTARQQRGSPCCRAGLVCSVLRHETVVLCAAGPSQLALPHCTSALHWVALLGVGVPYAPAVGLSCSVMPLTTAVHYAPALLL